MFSSCPLFAGGHATCRFLSLSHTHSLTLSHSSLSRQASLKEYELVTDELFRLDVTITSARHPKPSTPDPKPYTLNPKPSTLDPEPSTQTLNHEASTPNPQP